MNPIGLGGRTRKVYYNLAKQVQNQSARNCGQGCPVRFKLFDSPVKELKQPIELPHKTCPIVSHNLDFGELSLIAVIVAN